jgi:hypothetical protein
MATTVQVAGRDVRLAYPISDGGVKIDFGGCMIRNDYGLAAKIGPIRTRVAAGANDQAKTHLLTAGPSARSSLLRW